jgi:hypothetical protein
VKETGKVCGRKEKKEADKRRQKTKMDLSNSISCKGFEILRLNISQKGYMEEGEKYEYSRCLKKIEMQIKLNLPQVW